MELKDILTEYLQETGLSHRAFSERSRRDGEKGISAGYVSMIINDRNPQTGRPIKPNIGTLKSIAAGMGITLHQLMERMNPDAVIEFGEEPEEREIDTIYASLNTAGQSTLCAYGRRLASMNEYKAVVSHKVQERVIPLLGASFAAGSPETAGDLLTIDYVTTSPVAEFAIHINGDSMEPHLSDGSIAEGVKREPRDGEVGAFLLDGGFLVKQFCRDCEGNVYLFSLNRDRADADEKIWHDSGRDLRCVGTILMEERFPLP